MGVILLSDLLRNLQSMNDIPCSLKFFDLLFCCFLIQIGQAHNIKAIDQIIETFHLFDFF